MSKKMKRELKKVDDHLATVERIKKHFKVDSHPYELYFAQKRADIANSIGRKKN